MFRYYIRFIRPRGVKRKDSEAPVCIRASADRPRAVLILFFNPGAGAGVFMGNRNWR